MALVVVGVWSRFDHRVPRQKSALTQATHPLQLPEDGELYSARIDLGGPLPRLLVQRDVPGEGPTESIFGPLALTQDPDIDKSFVVFSEGEGFAHHLLSPEPIKDALRDVRVHLARVEIAPEGDGARLMIDVILASVSGVEPSTASLPNSMPIGSNT